MDKLNRVLNGKNMTIMIFVNIIHHSCKRCGFTRTRRPGDQYDASWSIRNLLKNLRCAQFFQGQNLGRNGTKNRTGTTVMIKRIYTKTRQTRNFKRKVSLPILFKSFALFVIHDVIQHAMNIFMIHRVNINTSHITINTYHRRQPR